VRRPFILLLALVFAVALLARAVTYTVRFTEAGVLTTFGKASEQDVAKMSEAGLKFKWPDPIQSVTKYDRRSRFLQTRAEQQQTADSSQITVEAFCTWRVADPLRFFQRFSNAGDRAEDHYRRAETVISANLRSALGEVSKYRMGELFTTDPRTSKLMQLEGNVLKALAGGEPNASTLADYGVEVTSVGVNRIQLPEENTKQVFESMKQERKRLIDALDSRGASEAQSITSAAENNATKILKFAEAYAAEIRQAGDREAQQYVAQMNENPELAVFLKQIDFMKELLASRITMVLNAQVAGFGFAQPPAISRDGRISTVEKLTGANPVETATTPAKQEPVTPVSSAAPGARP
jgi:modulator of FtsH protease HflC